MTFPATIANSNPARAALFFGHVDETWRDALERFRRFGSEVVDEWRDEDADETHVVRLQDSYAPEDLLRLHAALSVDAILDLERLHDVRVPAGLVSLLTEQGGFTLWPSGRVPCLAFFDGVDSAYPRVMNLRQALEFRGLHRFVAQELSAEALSSIERDLFCFAIASFADADVAFLLFDRDGRFLFFDFVDDDVDHSVQGIEALLARSGDGAALDDLIRRSVNWSVFRLLDAVGVPVDEYRDWRDRWHELFPVGYGMASDSVWRMRVPTID